MPLRQILLATATASIVAFAAMPASSQTMRYANQGELKSLDPYTLKETTTIAHHAHVYEGLVTRDKELKIAPGARRKLGNARSRPAGVFICARASNSTTATPSPPMT